MLYNKEGVPIAFQTASLNQVSKIQKTLYIFALDTSFSMRGILWEQLTNCLTVFLKKLENDVEIRNNSKISVVRYDNTSDIVFD